MYRLKIFPRVFQDFNRIKVSRIEATFNSLTERLVNNLFTNVQFSYRRKLLHSNDNNNSIAARRNILDSQ